MSRFPVPIPGRGLLGALVILLSVPSGIAIGAPDSPDADAPTTGWLREVVDDTVLDGHVVMVDFFASWCGPCRKSFPWMIELAPALHDDGFRIIAVNVDRNPKLADDFLARYEVPFPVVRDPEGSLAKRFGLEVMPTSFVFDRTGALAFRHEGFHEKGADELEARLRALVAAPAAEETHP